MPFGAADQKMCFSNVFCHLIWRTCFGWRKFLQYLMWLCSCSVLTVHLSMCNLFCLFCWHPTSHFALPSLLAVNISKQLLLLSGCLFLHAEQITCKLAQLLSVLSANYEWRRKCHSTQQNAVKGVCMQINMNMDLKTCFLIYFYTNHICVNAD